MGNNVPAILRQLRRKRVAKITFFLSAPWVAKHPHVARKIRSLGYEIGSHGYAHVRYTRYANRWIEEQVMKAENIIRKETGVRTTLIRTPYGDLDDRVVKKLRS